MTESRTLATWKRNERSHFILESTNDAIELAQLAHLHTGARQTLWETLTILDLRLEVMKEHADNYLDHMLKLACYRQFTRECLEECRRIEMNLPSITATEG